MSQRRLEIVVVTTRRFTLRRPVWAPAAGCAQCSGPLISAEVAVAVTGLSSRAIDRLVEAGEVHFSETPAGALHICLNSLAGSVGEAEAEPLPQLFSTKGEFPND